MISASLLLYGLPTAGALGFGIGVLAANWLWHRSEKLRSAEALDPFTRPIDPPEPVTANNNADPWRTAGDAANSIVEAARVAMILRRESVPPSIPEAAE